MLRYDKSKGYVLFMMILFLHIFSLMSVYELSILKLSLKTNNFRSNRNSSFLHANQALISVEKNIIPHLKFCKLKILNTQDIKQNSISWWQEHACHDNLGKNHYYYFATYLNSDPCVILNNDNNHIITIDYYRVTLALFDAQKVILQSIIAVSSGMKDKCQQALHQVFLGRQMWNELP